MMSTARLLILGVALSGCETPSQGTASSPPAPVAQAPSAQACPAVPIALADGRSVQSTCGTYKQCTLFRAVVPAGARSTGLPFFVTRNGVPSNAHPGAGNCL